MMTESFERLQARLDDVDGDIRRARENIGRAVDELGDDALDSDAKCLLVNAAGLLDEAWDAFSHGYDVLRYG